MGVADDVAGCVELLGRRVVGGRRVSEVAGIQVVDPDGDGEGRVRRQHVVVLGVEHDGRHHVGLSRNVAHDDTVAGARLDLQAVRQRLTSTVVDEVGVVPVQWPSC